jgi:hypothetical protein
MDSLVIIIVDNEDKLLLKKHKMEAILYINSLIKKTKAE